MKANPFLGRVYNAVVTAVKKDRVIFAIEREVPTKAGIQTVTDNAAYFVHGERINLHKTFSKGQTVPVRVTKVCHPPHNAGWLSFIVRPEILPVDIYLQDHPVGSTVLGTITAVTGATMIVMLDDNVYALTKRSKHARTGISIRCKIDKFRNDKLSIRVFQ